MAIPVIIVSGFLGGGKTTFLRHLLPACGGLGIRPALVINESGPSDVDGRLLSDLVGERVSLLGGCICCTMQADLAAAVSDLAERGAGDAVIIECSGFSSPQEVLSALAEPVGRGIIAVRSVVGLIDAFRFRKIPHVLGLMGEQMESADLLLLNKADLVPVDERPGVEARVREVVGGAKPLVWTDHGDLGKDGFALLLQGREWAGDKACGYGKGEPCACDCREHDHGHDGDHCHGHDHPGHRHGSTPTELPMGFKAISIRVPDMSDTQGLEAFMIALPPDVVRAKEVIRTNEDGWMTAHRVFGRVSVEPYAGEGLDVSELVCIGPGLDADTLLERIGE